MKTEYLVASTFSERMNTGTDKEYWTTSGNGCRSSSGPFVSRESAETFAAGLAQQRGDGRMLLGVTIKQIDSD